MIKNFYILAFTVITAFSYGQKVTFESNVSYDARILKQSLNKTGDSLFLESIKNISQVDIFNENFFLSIDIDSTKSKIDLNKLPIGNFIILAGIEKKWIVMTLEKKENHAFISSYVKEKDLTTINKPDNSLQKNTSAYYWVVSESNSGFGSCKSMWLEYKADIPKLIHKIELELKSSVGKNNKLLVYEVYNRSQFMTKQLRNSSYYQSETSELFNVVPFYASTNYKKN